MTACVIPDILDVTGLLFSRYAAKGLFEDLYPFIDADPELQRDDLVENVIRLKETDGALYRAASYFGIGTLMGKSSVLGNSIGWTMDEFLAVVKNSPGADYPINPFIDKTHLFAELLSGNMDAYVDQKEGVCFLGKNANVQSVGIYDGG